MYIMYAISCAQLYFMHSFRGVGAARYFRASRRHSHLTAGFLAVLLVFLCTTTLEAAKWVSYLLCSPVSSALPSLCLHIISTFAISRARPTSRRKWPQGKEKVQTVEETCVQCYWYDCSCSLKHLVYLTIHINTSDTFFYTLATDTWLSLWRIFANSETQDMSSPTLTSVKVSEPETCKNKGACAEMQGGLCIFLMCV